MAITRRRLSIGLGGGAAAAMIPLAVVYACTSQIAISATSLGGLSGGAPGSTIAVSVTQVYPNARVVVDMDGRYVYSATSPASTSPTTSMSFSMTVPNWAPGEYYFTVTATGGPKDMTFTSQRAVFNIVAAPSSSQNGATGPTGLRQGASQVPGANGEANAAANGSQVAGSSATASAPQLSPAIAARVADRDGIAQAFPVSPASRASQSGATVALAPETAGQGNAMLTGLIVGVLTLAVGLPLLLMGFATVTALQRRATRTNSRNDSHSDRERLS